MADRESKNWHNIVSDPLERKVFEALADSAWDFRTIEGIARSSQLSQQKVEDALAKYPGLVRQSSIPDAKGRTLYTLRSRRMKGKEILGLIRTFVGKSST